MRWVGRVDSKKLKIQTYKFTEIQNTETEKYKSECSVGELGGSTRNSKYLSTEAGNQPDGAVATIKSRTRDCITNA